MVVAAYAWSCSYLLPSLVTASIPYNLAKWADKRLLCRLDSLNMLRYEGGAYYAQTI